MATFRLFFFFALLSSINITHVSYTPGHNTTHCFRAFKIDRHDQALPYERSESAGPLSYYPSPWMDPNSEWADAYAKAADFVSQLTLLEKVNLTTGLG
jgi:hypothetical protein